VQISKQRSTFIQINAGYWQVFFLIALKLDNQLELKELPRTKIANPFGKKDEFWFLLASGDKLKSPIEQEGSISANLLFAPH
jgi:hypothetical protein